MMDDSYLVILKNSLMIQEETKEETNIEKVFDNTIDKLIFEEVFNKYDKLTWQETFINSQEDRFFVAKLNINENEVQICISKVNADFGIVFNNKWVVIDNSIKNYEKREELLNKIKPLITEITKSSILDKLRSL